MTLLFQMLVPLIMAAVALYAMTRRVDVYPPERRCRSPAGPEGGQWSQAAPPPL